MSLTRNSPGIHHLSHGYRDCGVGIGGNLDVVEGLKFYQARSKRPPVTEKMSCISSCEVSKSRWHKIPYLQLLHLNSVKAPFLKVLSKFSSLLKSLEPLLGELWLIRPGVQASIRGQYDTTPQFYCANRCCCGQHRCTKLCLRPLIVTIIVVNTWKCFVRTQVDRLVHVAAATQAGIGGASSPHFSPWQLLFGDSNQPLTQPTTLAFPRVKQRTKQIIHKPPQTNCSKQS